MKSYKKELEEDNFQILSVLSFRSESKKSNSLSDNQIQQKQSSSKSGGSSSLGSLFQDISKKVFKYTNSIQPRCDNTKSISSQSKIDLSQRRCLKDIDFKKDKTKSIKQYQAREINQSKNSQLSKKQSDYQSNLSVKDLDQQGNTFGTLSKPFSDGCYIEGVYLDQSDFEDSISVSDGKSSIISKRTISSNQISHRIVIIDNQKYQINKPTIQIQKQFKKSDQQKQLLKENQLKVICIDKFLHVDNCWDQLDTINRANPTNETTYMIYRQILNSQLSVKDQENHAEVKDKIITESNKQKNSYFTILLALEKYIKDVNNDIQVIFCEKSSLKTQVSLKMISTGFAFHKFKCIEKISQNKFSTFEHIVNSSKIYQSFEVWYQQQIVTRYKVPLQNIKITSIFKLSNNRLGVEWDTYDPSLIYQNKMANERIKVSPYFKRFYLSIEDFDNERGNITFPTKETKIFMRGNYPYYSSSNCSRFSIKVWNKYDSGNNEWLSMKNGSNQWGSVFFGLCQPRASNPIEAAKDPNISFQETEDQLQIPIQLLKNTLKKTISINTNQVVGEGILCTPYMWNAIKNTHEIQVNGQTYALVFQCRFNPQRVKITKRENYWMVNQFADIRPYGIILVKQSVKKQYPKPEATFKYLFSYNKWKQTIQQKKKSAEQSTTKN